MTAGTAEYGIAVFHNLGDVLTCTPVARQLKLSEPTARVTWFTSTRSACVLEHNPHVDEVVVLAGEDQELDAQIRELETSREWKRFFAPAAHICKPHKPTMPLFEQVRVNAKLDWIVPNVFVLRLSNDEVRAARRYWNRLPEGKKILVETQFRSDQSIWDEGFAFDLIDGMRRADPTFVFTGITPPTWFESFRARWPKAVWCREPFRLNAEFLNLCDAFVGVSSGISALAFSEHCRRDIPHIEVTRGVFWGGSCLPHPEGLHTCFTRARYREALASVAARLLGGYNPSFAPRGHDPVRCPACGCVEQEPGHSGFVVCADCGIVRTMPGRVPTNSAWTPAGVAASGSRPAKAFPESRLRHLTLALEIWQGQVEGARLIDVSAADGGFVRAAMERGMVAQGFGATAVAPELREDDFMQIAVAEASADVVVLPHALHERSDALAVLEKCEYVLAPGGVLLVITPNWTSVGNAVLGAGWPFLGDGAGMHFTSTSLRKELTQLGFYVHHAHTTLGEADPRSVATAMLKIKPDIHRSHLHMVADHFSRTGNGEELVVVGRKRGRTKARVEV